MLPFDIFLQDKCNKKELRNILYPGEVDNLARTYSSSVDLAEVYTSLTDTSTVVRKILQTTITVSEHGIEP